MTSSDQRPSESATPGPSRHEDFWAAAGVRTGLIELDQAECLELLAAKSVGRIAYASYSRCASTEPLTRLTWSG